MSDRGELTLLDEVTIRAFLDTEYPRLVAGIALIAGSRPAAEDAVQEALARAWERSERGEQIDSLSAWATRVAVNLSRSALRRLRAERRAKERLAGDPALNGSGPSGAAVDVARALAALPRRQREATVLRYYLEMDVAEVASALGVSGGTAKTTLHRARKKLAIALGESDREEVTDRGV